MKRPFLHRIFLFFVLIVLTTSCSSNLDFNQKIGELSPYFEVTDIFNKEVNINKNNQIISGTPSNSSYTYTLPPQTIPFDINTKLTDNGIVSYLKKVVFHVTLTNTTNNEFFIKVVFLNGSVPLTKFTTDVSFPANESKPQNITFFETDIPNLKSVTNIKITGFMKVSGSTIPSGTISVKSDATIYL
jgi:ABC-type Fe3+-hydroxamate transport system substrate-binding protein